MDNARKEYIKSCEVSELVEVELGGFKQKILIEGFRKDLPVVITLHGGPGTPVPFSVGCRGLFPEWTKKFLTVFWDQLGCGINNYRIDNGFKCDSFADMTCDLISYIRQRFPESGIYLLGISWGSILALKAALRKSEIIDGVVASGQVVKGLLFNEKTFASFGDAPNGVKRRIEKIKNDGKDCAFRQLDKNLRTLSKYLNKYTDGGINRSAKSVAVGAVIKGLMTSPDYSFHDFVSIAKNGYRGNESLWRELLNIDLSSELAKVGVPYRIVQGETDLFTPAETVLNTVEECGNKNLSCTVIANCGHVPSEAGMNKIFEILCETAGIPI